MNLFQIQDSGKMEFSNEDVKIVFDFSCSIYNREYDKINKKYKKRPVSTELGMAIGAITESQKLIDHALESEKKGGAMNMCTALEELRRDGIKEGMEKGIEKGIEKGKQEGIEEGTIKGYLETYKELEIPLEDARSKIIRKFSLSEGAADKYIKKYWKSADKKVVIVTYKPLPVGTDDFGKLINMGYYYIDKTLLIKELIDKKGEANLFIRPRRFGKTLNMSMLQYFFEDTGNEARNLENSRLFSGLKIMSAGDRYLSEQNHYPVISLSLKSAKQSDWTLSFLMIRKQIAQEFKRHQNILEKLSVYDRKTYEQILEMPDDMGLFLDSLAFLSHCLEKAYGEKVIVLIDEYDVPLENAYFNGFYRQMIEFIRSLFESVLKTNSSLYFAVITGCLRITKESIFTGLNNLKINSILNCNYDEYFGFTQAEIQELLETYGCEGKLSEIQEWYDGYLFGKTKIYNPWSVLNYLDNAGSFPIPYWSNTSSNNIIRTLIEKADSSVRAEIEDLIAGKTIEKPVHEDITYEDISSSMDNLWNFLFFTGYLKQNGQRMVDSEVFVTLSIPNTEVRQLYKTKILGWFQDELEQKDLSGLYQNMLEGNVEDFQCDLTNLLQNSISFYDNVEAFYHGFMTGVLGQLKSYIVRSNRESGDGRYDILVRSTDVSKPVIIMEFKASRSYLEMESAAARGLMQIQEKEYAREFKEDGYTSAVFYGIAFYKKNCVIQMQKETL